MTPSANPRTVRNRGCGKKKFKKKNNHKLGMKVKIITQTMTGSLINLKS